MSQVLIDSANMAAIGAAIRYANGGSDEYLPEDMPAPIRALKKTLVQKSITQNGEYDPADDGADGYSEVTVNVQGGITPTGTININANGTVDVTQYASANVNVQPNLQSKTATQNGTVTPDSGYDGLSSVLVDVSGGGGSDPPLPSDYQEVEYLVFDGHEWMTVNDTPADFVYIGVAKHTGDNNYSRLIGYRPTSATNTLDFDLRLSGTTVTAYVRSSSIIKAGKLLSVSEDSVCSVWAVFFGLRTTFFISKYYNETDSGAGLPFAGQYYGFELYSPATLEKTMKFIPCYHKISGIIGFYEVYTGTFYPNEGTGELGKGPDVT